MKQEHRDSRRHYFVTAPLQGPAPLDICRNLLRAAILARADDPTPRILAMVALPDRVLAVVSCRPWPGAPIHRRQSWHHPIWQRSERDARPRHAQTGFTAAEITSPASLRERLDFCHFAPVLHGLVPNPMDWTESTIRAHAPSDMILA